MASHSSERRIFWFFCVFRYATFCTDNEPAQSLLQGWVGRSDTLRGCRLWCISEPSNGVELISWILARTTLAHASREASEKERKWKII